MHMNAVCYKGSPGGEQPSLSKLLTGDPFFQLSPNNFPDLFSSLKYVLNFSQVTLEKGGGIIFDIMTH